MMKLAAESGGREVERWSEEKINDKGAKGAVNRPDAVPLSTLVTGGGSASTGTPVLPGSERA